MFVLILVLAAALVEGSDEFFAGAASCGRCHEPEYSNWLGTRHARAFETLAAKGAADDVTCYECHTVGFGKEGGFLSPGVTPQLAGVQCESCHGPAGRHVRDREKLRPVNPGACIACHTVDIDQDFDPQTEWERIRH